MKMWKKSILIFGAFIMLVLTSIPSLAVTETEGTNDVFHGIMSGGAQGFYYTDEKDNIDITSISYEVNNGNVTLTMTVDGVIEDSGLIVYYVYYTSAEATYWMMYANGSGIVYCDKDYTIGTNAEVTASGNTITGVFPLYGTDTSKVDLYGTAYQYTQANNPNAEYWVDWNPNAHTGAPAAAAQEEDDGGDTDSGDDNKGSPGFEAIVLIAAIAVALIILRRKK
jgi:hypothetical protein